MTTRQISFSVQGMFCAKCAASIERALTPLDGVAAAHVNYAAERASVMYDPARVTTGAIVQAVRGQGFAVPTELVTVYSNDLLYATFSRSIERWLARAEGIVKVSANIVARQVAIEIIPEAATREGLTRQLARFGFHAVEALSPDAWAEFVARGMVIAVMGVVLLWGAANHSGVLSAAGELPSPILLGTISALVLFGVGLPFFRRAFAAIVHGEFDGSVLLALVVIAAFLCGAVVALVANARPERIWFAWSAFMVASMLVTSWFTLRGFTTFVLPRILASRHALGKHLSAEAHLGVISNDTRR